VWVVVGEGVCWRWWVEVRWWSCVLEVGEVFVKLFFEGRSCGWLSEWEWE
jgi:hypothetical protein